ncbi:hypothetical protein GCM10009790_35560 [Georgenia ruanii]
MSPRPAPAAGAAPAPPPDRRASGGVTAELAVALPGVVLLLLVLLTAASAALTQVRVADAARAGARAAALGEPAGQVSAVAAHLAGRGVAVHVGREGGYVVVEVARDLPGPLAVAGLRASATARALPEPGEQG